MTSITLRKVPEDLNEMLIKIQAGQMIEKKSVYSKEKVVFKILREYGEQKGLIKKKS